VLQYAHSGNKAVFGHPLDPLYLFICHLIFFDQLPRVVSAFNFIQVIGLGCPQQMLRMIASGKLIGDIHPNVKQISFSAKHGERCKPSQLQL
jgi:hypothetical protein